MKIGLIDVDSHNFPNFALMKISAWHKQRGDTVEWYDLFTGHCDIVYMSKIFTFSPDYSEPIDADVIEKGGTGIQRLREQAQAYSVRKGHQPLGEPNVAFQHTGLYGLRTSQGFQVQ